MKIAIDARESGTSTGRYIDKLIENLAKLKAEFDMVVLTKPSRVSAIQQSAPMFEVIASEHKEFSFSEQYGFLKLLNSLDVDLVHFGMTQQPIGYRGKTVTTIHDLTTARFNNPAKNRTVYKAKQVVYRQVIKRVAAKSEHLITPSRFVKNDVAQYTKVDPAKISVIYESADKISAAAEPLSKLIDKHFIMYVGRALPHKNLSRLVEAFASLRQDRPDLLLVLGGKNDANYETLKHEVAKNDIKGVIFTGFVSDGQLRWLYENTSAYVFPSLSEGFGLPGLEAMVHGAPVVASHFTCLPEVYGQAAHYFDPLDAADICKKIAEILNNPQLRKKLVSEGHKQAAKFSWRATAEQTLAVYNSVLA